MPDQSSTSTITCPSDEDLRRLQLGRFPSDRFQSLLNHVDACTGCQDRLQQWSAPGDSLVQLLLPGETDPDQILAEPDCQAALYHASRARPMPADALLPPVDQLGPYRLVRPLGRGGMGAVYLAEHDRLGKQVAIKLLPRERCFDDDWLARFDREMKAVASLNHPAIVTATDAGEAKGWHYLVMEYLDGLDLAELMRRVGPLPIGVAAGIGVEVCQALSAIHEAVLVHRDIKPSNVMLTRGGEVKVLDLGLVTDETSDQAEFSEQVTTLGHVIGTLVYAAPEQLSRSGPVSASADLYALGATLYHLISGQAAHSSRNGIGPLVLDKTSKPASSLATVVPDAPGELVTLIDRMLAREPQDRPKSVDDVRRVLATSADRPSMRSLIRRAVRVSASEDVSQYPTAVIGNRVTTTPPIRRFGTSWPMLPGMFVAFVAAIVIWIQTDRGTLVIESELDDLQVTVSRDDEVVEDLRVQLGANDTMLRSGTYTVRLNTPADGVSLSDTSVSIRRGGEAVVKVTRADTGAAAVDAEELPSSKATKLFRGQRLEHWVQVMTVERDVESLTEAMEAIASLAGPEDVDAAHAILVTARTYGTLYGRENSTNPSSRFMHAFDSKFDRLLLKPGMAAIVRETERRHSRSLLACLNALTELDSSTNSTLVDWAIEEPAGRGERLRRNLNQVLADSSSRLSTQSMAALRNVSLSLTLALPTPKAELAMIPGLSERLTTLRDDSISHDDIKRQLEAFNDEHLNRSSRFRAKQSNTPIVSPAEATAAELLDIELPMPLLVRALLSRSRYSEGLNRIYRQRLSKRESEVVDATVWAMITNTDETHLFQFQRLSESIGASDSLWSDLLPLLVSKTKYKQLVYESLRNVSGRAGYLSEEMQSLVEKSMENLEVQFQVPSASPKSLTYAKRIFDRQDANKDGVLTPSEWSNMLVSPASADVNQDGKVTVDEYATYMDQRSRR
ncbi:MAG: protein kinase [Planctomycetota bacterium]